MILGDWEVIILEDKKLGDGTRGLSLNCRYIPQDYSIPRSIQIIKPLTDEQLKTVLKEFCDSMKTYIIDVRDEESVSRPNIPVVPINLKVGEHRND